MSRLFRSAWVIARRDYVATVWSKTFLIFLLAPVLPLLMGLLLQALDGGDEGGRHHAQAGIALAADPQTTHALLKARSDLAARLGTESLPRLDPDHRPAPDQPTVSGTLDHPRLSGSADAIADLQGRIALIVDHARTARALGSRAPAPVRLQTMATSAPAPATDRSDVAHGGQLALFFLTILLAGMMISNMAEEKSNKVIELLAAAVPIDAIFFGKLLAILGASLTGLVVWGAMAFAGVTTLMHGSLPAPAVGWPMFAGLGLAYFVTVFLLWGAIYLGVGAQAGSAREAQTLSMPMTLGEAVAYILATSQVMHPTSALGLAAAIIPWSSPFAMIGRAAVDTQLWPHLLALVWQIVVIVLTVRAGAALFRRNILKSGGSGATSGGRWFGRRRRET